MESKIVETKGEKESYYKKFTLPSYVKCNKLEKEIFGIENKRDLANDTSLYLFKIKLEDGDYFYKISTSSLRNPLFPEFSLNQEQFFVSEANAVEKIKASLINYKNN